MRKYAPALLVAAALAGGLTVVGLLNPSDPAPAQAPPAAAVEELPLVIDDVLLPGYDRDLFGAAWADIDRNGCNQRQDVIIRDTGAARSVRSGRCYADMGGKFYRDPYTGESLPDAKAIEIDHVVSLADAWRSGAARWTSAERKAFANDLTVLWAVSAVANQDKSDRTPDAWLPPDGAVHCEFQRRYVDIKVRYKLTVTSKTWQALDKIRRECAI